MNLKFADSLTPCCLLWDVPVWEQLEQLRNPVKEILRNYTWSQAVHVLINGEPWAVYLNSTKVIKDTFVRFIANCCMQVHPTFAADQNEAVNPQPHAHLTHSSQKKSWLVHQWLWYFHSMLLLRCCQYHESTKASATLMRRYHDPEYEHDGPKVTTSHNTNTTKDVSEIVDSWWSQKMAQNYYHVDQ